MPVINFTGLVTGLDTDRIIQGLLEIQNRRIQSLTSRRDQVTVRQNALVEVSNRLRALQESLLSLARSQNNVLEQRKVTVNAPELVTATASVQATPGTYTFQVLSTARPHQLASQGFDSPDSAITTGTLTIRVGQSSPVNLVIDNTNNTLRGLAAAINAAQAGVSATIIHDGSAHATQPYRLILTAREAGADNLIALTNHLAADTPSARKPIFDLTYIGPAVRHAGNTGTATATSNQGAGIYSGTASKSFTLTVLQGGTVGADNIVLRYEDSTGTLSGEINLGAGDEGVYKTVAQGVQIKFSAGVLQSGDKFSIDVYAPQIQAPSSAQIRLGSGEGALILASNHNRWDNVFEGVSFTVQAADPNRTVQLQVTHDVEQARKAITSLVEKYNELMNYLNQQTAYDAQSGQSGPLFGNRAARQIQDDLRRLVSEAIPGLPSRMNRLSALGISLTDRGTLELDNNRLNQVLSGQVPGVTLEDVRRLFAFVGQSNHGAIRFIAGSDQTESNGVPIQVDITQAARQARLTALQSLGTSVVLDDSNNQLSMILDGKYYDIRLTPGSYSRQRLAEELQERINAAARGDGRQVAVTLADDRLQLRSHSYGTRSQIHLTGGTALAVLGFSAGQQDSGQDVAGVFIIQGETEPARGVGQLLIGEETNRITSGLQVRIGLTDSQLVAGAEGELVLSRGVAARLDRYISRLLEVNRGLLATGRQALEGEAQRLQESINRMNDLVRQQRESLEKQFRRLENAVSQLRGLGDMLTMQFQALLSNNPRFNRR
ncbi:MAG: flagellar filament capping protein FliD [Gemmatales bacterium]|nr:flagellar filament capping protein FliD [Gemmatales bacterium]